jgi:glutathione S-transferase
MITLYNFGPSFGLPDPSPFVTKAELLLKMARLEYRCDPTGFNKAPKGKLPYIKDDDGTLVADSSLIREHLERTRGIDFDDGLTNEERAIARAFQALCEEHLYWAVVSARWADDGNFDRGPRKFFDAVPWPMRPVVVRMVRKQVQRDLKGQGLGRHTRDELTALGGRSIDALAMFLGDKPYAMGDRISALDATVFPFVAGTMCDLFDTPLKDAAKAHQNLSAYCNRMMAEWYPDLNG